MGTEIKWVRIGWMGEFVLSLMILGYFVYNGNQAGWVSMTMVSLYAHYIAFIKR